MHSKEFEPRGPGFGLPLEGDNLLLNVLNPKFEVRSSKQIRIPNAQMPKTQRIDEKNRVLFESFEFLPAL